MTTVSHVTIAVAAVAASIALLMFALQFPAVIVIAVALVAYVALGDRAGLKSVTVAGVVLLMSTSALVQRAIPSVTQLVQVGVFVLVGLGLLALHRRLLPQKLTMPILLYLLIATAATVRPAFTSMQYGFEAWVGLTFPVLAAAAAVGAYHSDGPRGGRLMLGAAIVGTMVVALVGYRQTFAGLTSAEVQSAMAASSTYRVGDEVRLMGSLPTNQDFALLLGCGAPALLALALGATRNRRLLFMMSAAAYIVILLSLTRTALITSCITGILVLAIWGRGRFAQRTVGTVAVVTATGGIIWAVAAQIDTPRVQAALTRALTLLDLSEDKSFNARRSLVLPRAWDAFMSNPFGAGAGSAGPVSQQYLNISPLGSMTTDNGYLMVAIQTGFLGIALFMWMLIATILYLSKSKNNVAHAGCTVVVALLIAMVTAQYWSLFAPIAILFVIVGLGIAAAQEEQLSQSVELERSREITPPGFSLHQGRRKTATSHDFATQL